jgi:hypothetical protein
VDLQCEAVHKRYIQCIEGEKVIQIGECDNKNVVTQQKVVLLVLNHYIFAHLLILDVVVMKFDTILTCFTELVGTQHRLSPYILRVNLCHSCPLQ